MPTVNPYGYPADLTYPSSYITLTGPMVPAVTKEDLDAVKAELEAARRDIAELKGMIAALLIVAGEKSGDLSEML